MSLPGKVTKNICNKTESCWYQWRNCVSFVIDRKWPGQTKCYKCYLAFGCLVFVNAIMWEHRFSNQIKLIEANYFAEWLWLRQFRMTETTFESWCNDIGSLVRPVIQSHDLLRKSHKLFVVRQEMFPPQMCTCFFMCIFANYAHLAVSIQHIFFECDITTFALK